MHDAARHRAAIEGRPGRAHRCTAARRLRASDSERSATPPARHGWKPGRAPPQRGDMVCARRALRPVRGSRARRRTAGRGRDRAPRTRSLLGSRVRGRHARAYDTRGPHRRSRRGGHHRRGGGGWAADGASPGHVRRWPPGGERRGHGQGRRGGPNCRRRPDGRNARQDHRQSRSGAHALDGEGLGGSGSPGRSAARSSCAARSGQSQMRVHLMGAGGAGVSALARVFLARGDDVSGCDLKESETTAELEEAGVKILVGHNPEHVLGQDLLVYSGAIKRSPELDAARAMAVKVLSRAEMLAQLINESDSIAVAGTAGKTTVTHMVGHILVTAGYDPTVLVGDGSSARAGKSDWLVAETDESDGTLTLHRPQRAIVTNIELDHPDHFRDLSAVRDLFQWFIEGLPASGIAVLCADDELARELKPRARKVTYGFRHGATYRCEPVRPFPIYRGADLLGHINLRQPGRHNIQNATGAAAMALEIGIGFDDIASALHTFPGAHRRMEFLGIFQGAAVYDDYAHHPTKLRATIEAARELRHRRLLVVFQPHRYSRLSALLHDFARSFEGADRVYVLDVYSAGEDNVSGVQAADLAHQVPQAIYVGDFTRAKEALKEIVGPDDLVLLMGAGDIKKLGDELAHKV